jgi:serine/threonine protein kinase
VGTQLVGGQRVGDGADAFERKVVLKFAPESARDSEQVLELFIRETWHATAMQQGDFFVSAWLPAEPSSRYYLMEFVDAPSLESVLKTRRLAPDEAAALGRFLAAAGEHLLRRDLVHGDIKPDNILVTGDPAKPAFKLVDLGSAAPVFAVTSRAGTASFLAPERFHGAPCSERTEIFAIGVTLYRALAGKLPFGEIERFQTPQFAPAKRPSDLNPNTPPWLDSVLLRCLSLGAEGRYQHFSDLAFDLANPGEVVPFGAPSAKQEGVRDPALPYKIGCAFLAALSLVLLLMLVTRR